MGGRGSKGASLLVRSNLCVLGGGGVRDGTGADVVDEKSDERRGKNRRAAAPVGGPSGPLGLGPLCP